MRGLGVLRRSAPIASLVYLLTSGLRGVAPFVVVVASARLVGLAPQIAESPAAADAAVGAVALVGAAAVASRLLDAFGNLLSTYVGFAVDAAFESERIQSVCGLPGLEHFEMPDQADRLELSVRAAQFPKIALATIVTGLQYGAASVSSLVLIGRVGGWAPALIVATSVPVMVSSWRHAGRRNVHSRMISSEMRNAFYYGAVPLKAPRETRLFGTTAWLRDRQLQLWEEAMAPHFAEVNQEYRAQTALAAIKALAVAAPLVVALQRFSSGTLGVATLSAVALAVGAIGQPLRWFERLFGDLRVDTAFLPEAFDVVDLPRVDPRLDISGSVAPPAVIEEGISFEGVTFRYPGSSRGVLNGLDLFLPGGETTALVGDNGAGKSTLVKLLCRMYDPTEGTIKIDGVDIREFDLQALRQRFAVLTQQFLRLPMTAAVNVGIGSLQHLEDEDVLQAAADEAGAAAVVARMPQGWNTVLARDFGGVELSGGEWQRVALARVLAARLGRGANVLVLDEPTAALDVRLEHDLFNRFASLSLGATGLLISHRYSTVQMAHTVAVLDQGRVVERGNHASLLQLDGLYARSYRLQASRFREEGKLA